MKLSVIVPVYNVDRYLAKCLDSILSQNLSPEDYQIIVIDDGSTDSSGQIADEYCSKYGNVVAIHQENGGLSCARNAGLDAAEGEYIQFVDSDDYLEPDALGGLVNKMDAERLDVLRFNYQNVNEDYEAFSPYKEMKSYCDYRDEVCDGVRFLNERLGYECYAVQFIIRKRLLVDNGLFFRLGMFYEDTEWTPRMLVRAKRVSSIEKIVYNYLSRTDSITNANSTDRVERGLKDKLTLIACLREQAGSVVDKRWHYGMISCSVLSILSTASIFLYDKKEQYINSLRALDVFPLSVYHVSARKSRKVKLINISPDLYCFVQHLLNRI